MSKAIATIKNNLTRTDIELINSLPASINEYVWLRQERAISALNIMEWKSYSTQVVTMANFDDPQHNVRVTDSYLEAQALQLREEFEKYKKFKELTVAELIEAFKRGIRGEAGKYYGLNPKTFHLFIRWFYEHPDRQASWVKYKEKLDAADLARGLSEEQKMVNSKNSIRVLFENYKNTQQLGTCPWFYYGALCDIIGIEVEYKPGKKYKTLFEDPAIRSEVNAVAEKEYQETQEFEQVEEDSIYQKGRADMVAMNRIIIEKMNKDDALTRLKKVAALRRYFDDLIKENKTLQI